MSAPAFFSIWFSHKMVSSCSSSVARYAVSTMLRIFMAPLLFRRDYQHRVALGDGLEKIFGAASARAFNPIACATLVHTQAAVDPVELDALLASQLKQGSNPILGCRVILFLNRRSLDRIGMLRL